MPAHKHFTKHQIISHDGTAGKNLCVAPLTGAMAQCLEEHADRWITSSASDWVAHAMLNASLGQPAHFQPACALSQVEFLRLQVRQLNRHMALLQLHKEQEEAHHMYLLCQQLRKKAKKSLAREQAVSRQLRQELIAAKHQLTQGRHHLAGCNEAHKQLKQQLAEGTGHREELRRQLQGKQLELDQAKMIIAEHQQTQKAQQKLSSQYQLEVGNARSEPHTQQQCSTQLQAQLQKVQADLDDISTVAAAKANEVISLQFQNEVLKEAKERVEVELKAAAAASVSAAKAARAQHEKEVASHTCAYARLYGDFEKELQQQSKNTDCLETQLEQVQADLAQASSALAAKTEAASALNTELEQLRHEISQQQNAVLAGEEEQEELGSPATTRPDQDPASVPIKASMLHGMEAVPSLAGLELKPRQGRTLTDGAASDSPIAPNSPLIAAKNPFTKVSRPAQEQKQSPLGSPETAARKHQQTGPGQGESPRLTENPEGSQAALPSEALPSERKMVAEAASESDAGDGKKMPRAPEPEAEVGGNDAGLATSLWAQPTEANAKGMDRVAPTHTATDDMPPGPLPTREGETLEMQQSNSEASLDLAEARPVQNATDGASKMVRDTINATQSSESVSVGGDHLDDDDAYEYPFCAQIRWLKEPADRRLGVGGTAQVFRAQLVSSDKQSVTDVAVKQFTPPFDRRAAEHEARVLQELEDKWYTMDLHNFYTAKLPAAGASSTEAEEECAFLVMGVFQGKDLEEVCSAINQTVHATPPGAQLNALMTWAFQFSLKTFYYLAQAMSDLHETHSHRDFKPANVMVSGWDEDDAVCLVLIDFASSFLHKEERTCHVLSPMASSPELLRYHLADDKAGLHIMDDRRNDAYALGITLFSLLTCATRHWGLMFQPSMAAYQQIRAAAPSEKTTKTMLAFQEQQTVWAETNPYYVGRTQPYVFA
ncbi:hypothetical protein WJX79_001607 [Trebouxia sp. C0005]